MGGHLAALSRFSSYWLLCFFDFRSFLVGSVAVGSEGVVVADASTPEPLVPV